MFDVVLCCAGAKFRPFRPRAGVARDVGAEKGNTTPAFIRKLEHIIPFTLTEFREVAQVLAADEQLSEELSEPEYARWEVCTDCGGVYEEHGTAAMKLTTIRT